MSTTVQNKLLESDEQDLEARLRARRLSMAKKLLELYPEVTMDVRLDEMRLALRGVLAMRSLSASKEHDARIDACNDLATLKRWHGNAITAASAADALR
jgi:hypothetical protein